jgi:AraC-like DNA-binding protein
MVKISPRIEALPSLRSCGFLVTSFQKTRVDFHWHFHPEFELTFIEKGMGARHVGRSIMAFGDGDFCLLGGNLPHAYRADPGGKSGARWTVMHFIPEAWGDVFWTLPQNWQVRQLLSQAGHGIKFEGPESEPCAQLLRSLVAPSSQDVPMAIWIELFNRLARIRKRRLLNPADCTRHDNGVIDPRFRKILAWVEAQADSDTLTQRAAARHSGMSAPAFSRFFGQHLGRPFHLYVNEVRIARACARLARSDTPISEIAFQSGFGNLSNFNRRFREIAGCTPRQYRGAGDMHPSIARRIRGRSIRHRVSRTADS